MPDLLLVLLLSVAAAPPPLGWLVVGWAGRLVRRRIESRSRGSNCSPRLGLQLAPALLCLPVVCASVVMGRRRRGGRRARGGAEFDGNGAKAVEDEEEERLRRALARVELLYGIELTRPDVRPFLSPYDSAAWYRDLSHPPLERAVYGDVLQVLPDFGPRFNLRLYGFNHLVPRSHVRPGRGMPLAYPHMFTDADQWPCSRVDGRAFGLGCRAHVVGSHGGRGFPGAPPVSPFYADELLAAFVAQAGPQPPHSFQIGAQVEFARWLLALAAWKYAHPPFGVPGACLYFARLQNEVMLAGAIDGYMSDVRAGVWRAARPRGCPRGASDAAAAAVCAGDAWDDVEGYDWESPEAHLSGVDSSAFYARLMGGGCAGMM